MTRQPHLRGPHLRVPDERPRLRTAHRPAGGRGVRRRAGRRAGRRGRVQHLRGPRERRQQALRQPRPPRAGEGAAPRHADRRRRLPRAEGPRDHHREGALGRRRVRHPQHRLAAGAAGAGPRAGGGAGRDPRVPRRLPLDAADQARVGVRRVGVDLGRLQQHLHVLHRPVAARQGEGPPARRDPRRDRGAGRRGRQRDHPAGTERQRVRRGVRRPAGVLQAAARRAAPSPAWSGSGSPRRTRPSSPTTSSRRWPRPRT